MFEDFCHSLFLALCSLPQRWAEWNSLPWRASRALLAAGTEVAIWLMRPSGRLPAWRAVGSPLCRCLAPLPPLVVFVPSRSLPSSSPPSSSSSLSPLSSPPRPAGAGPFGVRAGWLPSRPLAWGGPLGGLPVVVALPGRLPSPLSVLGDGVCASHVVASVIGLLAEDHMLLREVPPLCSAPRLLAQHLPAPLALESGGQACDCVTSVLRRSWPLCSLPCPRWVSFKSPRRCRRSASP